MEGQSSPSPSDDDSVVLLRTDASGTETICTGVVIAPNLVATARHCVSYLLEGTFRCTVQGEAVDNPEGGGTLLGHFPADKLEVYALEVPEPTPRAKGARILSTDSQTICINDLAFVITDRALDLPIAKVRLGTPTRRGELVTVIGYGLDETMTPDWRTRPRRKVRQQPVYAVGPDSIEDGLGVVPPRTLVLQGPSACLGDSGGPALSDETGAVVGINSLLSGTSCTSQDATHDYTNLPPFEALVREAFAAAGASPRLETEPEVSLPAQSGVGEPCAQPTDCQSGLCNADPEAPASAKHCVQACGDGGACPAGYECRAVTSGQAEACLHVRSPEAGCSVDCGAPSAEDTASPACSVTHHRHAPPASFWLPAVALALGWRRRGRRWS